MYIYRSLGRSIWMCSCVSVSMCMSAMCVCHVCILLNAWCLFLSYCVSLLVHSCDPLYVSICIGVYHWGNISIYVCFSDHVSHHVQLCVFMSLRVSLFLYISGFYPWLCAHQCSCVFMIMLACACICLHQNGLVCTPGYGLSSRMSMYFCFCPHVRVCVRHLDME
jgi:hypothetical protein